MAGEKVSDNEFTDPQKDVITYADKVNKVLVTGSIFLVALILFKLGIIQFNLYGIKAPVENAWFIALLFTIAHFWTGVVLLAPTVHNLWRTCSTEQGKKVFNEVTRNGSSFVSRLIPRTKYTRTKFVTFYRMSFNDPSTWAALGATVLLTVAIVPWDFKDFAHFSQLVVIALLIAFVNWLIGGIWIIALSGLTIEHDRARFHIEVDLRQHEFKLKKFNLSVCYPSLDTDLGTLKDNTSEHQLDSNNGNVLVPDAMKKNNLPENTS